MNLFETILSFVMPTPKPTGLIVDDAFTISQMPQHDQIFGSAPVVSSRDWSSLMPTFRFQGASYWCTAFAATNVKSALIKAAGGSETLFSPLYTFYASGGTVYGNRVSSTLNLMESGTVLEVDCPTPVPDSWGYAVWEKYKNYAVSNRAKESAKMYAVKSYANVIPERNDMKKALEKSPLIITIGIGRGYFLNPAPAQWDYSAYHALVCVKVEDDGRVKVFDSLEQKQGFSGFHWLAADYPILTATSVIDIPESYKPTVVDPTTLYFGKPRNLAAEQAAVNLLIPVSKTHPEIAGLLGHDWILSVNAMAYGGYTLTDILNQYFSIHRGLVPPFDLTEQK